MITCIHGDCRDVLPTFPAQSVQCVITSPPYFGLRKYGDDPRELGREQTPMEYVAAQVQVFRLCRRVLRDDGTLWIVIGDSYSHDSKWGGRTGGKHAQGLHGTESGIGRDRRVTGLGDKQLIGIPWRLALALQDDGWVLRAEIIWHKPNAMPESARDRPTRAHETIFLLSKEEHYYFDADAIKEPAVSGDPTAPREPRGAVGSPNAGRRSKQDDALPRLAHRNGRSVWTIPARGLTDEHYAPMPELLAERCVLAGSRAGDIVLDPFGGSGTVGRVAERFGRNAILIDLYAEYVEMQQRRTDQVQREMFV